MRKIVSILIVMFAVVVLSTTANAQNKLKVELGYNIAVPVAGFKSDFISNASFRGTVGEIKYLVNPRLAVGIRSGFQNFYQRYPRQIYKLQGNETVSAVVTNYLDVIPVLANATYFPLASPANAKIQPYMSGGAGVTMVTYGQYLGEFGGVESSTHFAAQAGAGVQIPFGQDKSQNGFKLGATYNYSPFNQNDLSKINSLGFNAGFVFNLK